MQMVLGSSSFAKFGNLTQIYRLRNFLEVAYYKGQLQIDTAPLYGSGDSEKLIGSILPSAKFPNYNVSTKFGLPYSDTKFPLNRIIQRISRPSMFDLNQISTISFQLEKSLKRLNRDNIDIYFVHNPPTNLNLDPMIDRMKELKKKGLIQRIGISTLVGGLNVPKEVDVVQIPWTLVNNYTSSNSYKLQVHSTWQNLENKTFADLMKSFHSIHDIESVVIRTTALSHYLENLKYFDI